MFIFNSLNRKKEEFLKPGADVRMFVCGPTVYDYIHLGNARTAVFFDMVAKWLRYSGYKVKYIQNITDIDDKIITRARETQKLWSDISEKFTNIYLENMRALKVSSVDNYPKATRYIKEIKEQVKQLLDKGNAYIIENDGIYFDLNSFPDYGKLSGRTVQMAEDALSRIDESDKKRNKGDFALWKFPKQGEPIWDAEFGAGRPGWHIEDTAITQKIFGPQYELHGGGIDLMFPHHEGEIAIQESLSGKKPFVRYWMHVEFLNMKSDKMSKSKGNFLTLNEALKEYTPEALRFYLLSAHYKTKLEYSREALMSAEAAVQRIAEFRNRISRMASYEKPDRIDGGTDMAGKIADVQKKIGEKMDDDFNTPKAFSHLFMLIKEMNAMIDNGTLSRNSASAANGLLKTIDSVFGIVPKEAALLPEDIQNIIARREQARKDNNYALADKLRDEVKSKGYSIDDTAYGPFVKQAGKAARKGP